MLSPETQQLKKAAFARKKRRCYRKAPLLSKSAVAIEKRRCYRKEPL
jgi:hypothetical protein